MADRKMEEKAQVVVDRILSDLNSSTWHDKFPDAMKELETYSNDIYESVLEVLKRN